MKLVVFVLVVLVVLGVVEGLSREDGEAPAVEGGVRSCVVVQGYTSTTGPTRFNDYVNMIVESVYPKSEVFELLAQAEATQQYSDVLKRYCRDMLSLNERLVKINEEATRCISDQVNVDKVKILSDFVQLVVNSSCVQDGERLVEMIRIANTSPKTRKGYTFARMCMTNSLHSVNLRHNNMTAHTFSMQQLQVLQNFRECIGDYAKRHDLLFNDVVSVVNEVEGRLNCVEESSGGEVLCTTLVTRTCPSESASVVEQGEVSEQLYDTSVNALLECYTLNENKTNMVGQLKEAITTEAYQAVFREVCNRKPSDRQCILKSVLSADLCLRGRYLKMFRVVASTLDEVYYLTCLDEGDELSTVLAAMHTSATTNDLFADSCFGAAVELLKAEAAAETRANVRLIRFRVWQAFTTCLASRDTDYSVAAVNLLRGWGERLLCTDDVGDSDLCIPITDDED